MKKKNLPLLENIEITGVAAEGKALARINDMVVFVPLCVPGDIVDLQVTRKKHSFMEAQVKRIIRPADQRCEPRCKHFTQCGGCKWQMLPYAEQLRWKQQQIEDNLRRIGHIELPEISPILGSKQTYEYRNKLEFTFADRKWLSWDDIHAAGGLENIDNTYGLGFHIPNCFDKVLDITECHLMPDYNNQIRNAIRDYARARGLTFYNEHKHEGQLRNLIIRSNHLGQLMVIIVFGEDFDYAPMLDWMHASFPQIISLQYVVNTKFNDTIGDLDIRVWYGQDHIIEQMEDLVFKVGPKSFYQTNTEQAYELYKVARDFAFFSADNTEEITQPLIYDLYTGTGTIANFVARQARQVIGIEYVPEAIEDARVNARLNHLDNTLFFAGDMKDILNRDFINRYGRPDVLITDPPRAGMHPDVIDTILFAQPRRIVYVSCNPATQARDLRLLDADYRVARVQPVDMFPHTQHVENVVLLTRR
ncbi:MAG: 23S rRNA (uracil(1939)-C(5))-methyltransferase RlmD [Paludibacteraceae bacterium]|nr:23S rRNA (uracil(1939)-C(5))-methyltransferase RlmD [Paludibacteraceae bacterium]